jgi:hypothetical protein
MTEQAFEVLDELYFVTKFDTLQAHLGWDKTQLLQALAYLLQKGWVKCLDGQDNILEVTPDTLPALAPEALFLATKEGLKAHHGLDS